MKKFKRQNFYLLTKRIERQNRRAKKKQKILRIRRSSRRGRNYSEKNQKNQKKHQYQETFVSIKAPINFSLIDNTEAVIDFINSIDKAKLKRHIKIVQINLLTIENVDICAISLLLTKINELVKYKKNYICILPKNDSCRHIIQESGFVDRMKEVQSGKTYQRNNKNLMVTRGFEKTDNKATGIMIESVLEHLTKEKNQKYQPLYSIIQEICSNSVEHANDLVQDKNWLIATNFKEDEVEFTLTDIGEGIIKTIKKKKLHDMLKTVGIISPEEILKNSFEKTYQSRTLDINRNKGLPRIYEVSNQNYILDLIVITNNVLCDFNHPEKSKKLNKNFRGTFYFWKLNLNCIEKWKNRKK